MGSASAGWGMLEAVPVEVEPVEEDPVWWRVGMGMGSVVWAL